MYNGSFHKKKRIIMLKINNQERVFGYRLQGRTRCPFCFLEGEPEMKKLLVASIAVTAYVALCAAVWPRSIVVVDLPAEPIKTAVTAEIEALSEEKPQILLSADIPAPELEPVAVNELKMIEITAEEKTDPPPPVEPIPRAESKSAPVSSEPKAGDKAIIDGKPHIWIPGFGWIEDHSGESVRTFDANMYENGNKIGVIDGGTTVGNFGDELTGNKVGIMGGGTVVDGKGDINKQVGIMGCEEPPRESTSPSAEQPEPTDGVIYIELQPTPTKDSTPPSYNPDTTNP